MAETKKWALVIHGGAGMMARTNRAPAADAAVRAALDAALGVGGAVLDAGGNALDAVEEAVRLLEDDPQFNAGRGAALTADGTVELDAAIMDGRGREAGAVAGATAIRNPVRLARGVMEATEHVLLAGPGADAFARTTGLEPPPADWFVTAERRRQLAESIAGGVTRFDREMKYGTVGAVARDAGGHVAAATSTGGLTGKRWGRVGDSPLIGAGTYADDRAGAVSATGAGEYFIRAGVAHEILARIRFLGEGIQAAVDAVVMGELTAMGGAGGVIAVGRDGTPAWAFNTPGMFRGRVASDCASFTAIYVDEG